MDSPVNYTEELSFSSPQTKELVNQLQALKTFQQAAFSQLLATQQKQRDALNSSLSHTPTPVNEGLSSIWPGQDLSMPEHCHGENKPVGSNRSFQELLDMKLKDDTNAMFDGQSNQKPKQPFLKKGSGLKRYSIENPETPRMKAAQKQETGFKRVVSPQKNILRGKNNQNEHPKRTDDRASWKTDERLDDSVDVDLNVKMRQADRQYKKELKDLALFELLENVADKSSFCSSSSIIARFMTEGSTSTPQAPRMSQPHAVTPPVDDESRHVRFADTFKYAEYTAEAESDSDTMVTSYGVDDLEDDGPSEISARLSESFTTRVVNKLRAQLDNPSQSENVTPQASRFGSMLTNFDSRAFDSDKENNCVKPKDNLIIPKAAITKEKVASEELQFSPPPVKRGLTPSHTIWEAFKDKTPPENAELNRVLQESNNNREAYMDAMRRVGLSGITESNNPAVASAVHSRVLELEKEINVFRKEANLLRRTRKEAEDLKSEVAEEKKRFEKQMENEKRRWQLQIEEEKKKVKSLEKQEVQVVKPSEELLDLRNKVEELTASSRVKETKWYAERTKLLSRIRYLESEGKVRSDELERLRKEEVDLKKRLTAQLRPKPVYAQTRPPSRTVETQTQILDPPAAPTPVKPPMLTTQATPFNTALLQKTETPCSERSPPTEAFKVTINDDGSKELRYSSGNVKTMYKDGSVKTVYYNKDVKIIHTDGTVKYTYAAKGVTQTTLPDGKEVYEYPEGHTETKFPSGRREVMFPGGCFAVFQPDGSEERQWPNGTKLWRDAKGNQALQMPNGDREICTPTCKRRELPDGTLITTFPDARKETRFPNGKVKVVDSQGQVIIDTRTGGDRPR